MAYIPPTQSRPWPRARELSERLHQTIEEFERHYPGTDRSDVSQALRIVSGDDVPERQSMALGIGLLVAPLVGLGVAFGFLGGGLFDGEQSPSRMIWLVGGLAVLLAIVAVARGRGS